MSVPPFTKLWACLLPAAMAPLAAYAGLRLGWPRATAVLVATAGLFPAVGALWRRVILLEKLNKEYASTLRRRAAGLEESTAADPDMLPSSAWEPTGDDPVNYALLLLTIQDVSRRVAMNLDLDTLVPTIMSSAKASLRCRDCRIYLWNAREKSLHDALPPRHGEPVLPAPDPRAGMVGWVLEQRQILTRDMLEDDRELRRLLRRTDTPPDAVVPLSVGGELLGLLVVEHTQHRGATFARLLYVLSDLYALGLKNAQLFRRVEELARRDGLTGLLNHASFQQELERLATAETTAGPLTVIMSDVDHFKRFNDTWGHQAGDHVLREIAALWRAVLPATAVIGRYGGEEFIAALPREDLDHGLTIAELLRAEMESYVFDFEGRQLHVTASFGVAQFGKPAATAHELVRLADEGLYAAKATGRNRVLAIPYKPAAAKARAGQPS